MFGLLFTILPALAGSLVCTVAWPGQLGGRAGLGIRLALGLGLGIGASSCGWFVWLVLRGPPSAIVCLAELVGYSATCVGLAIYAWRRAQHVSVTPRVPSVGAVNNALVALSLLVLVAKLSGFLAFSFIYPHGEGDAWFTWNMRARFLYHGGEHWKTAFSNTLGEGVGDYPLLLPLTVARVWHYLGSDSTWGSAGVALMFYCGLVGLLFSALALLRDAGQAAIAAMVLLSSDRFIHIAYSQVADVPLSFYVLATAVVWSLHDAAGRTTRLPILAGLMTGFAAWTKNDGIVVLAAVPLARLVEFRKVAGESRLRFMRPGNYFRELGQWLIGLAPVMAVWVYFKWQLAPEANYLLASQGWEVMQEKLTDRRRYYQIAASLIRQGWVTFGAAMVCLVIYRLLLGRRSNIEPGHSVLTSTVLILLMLLGYLAVYLITPLNLPGHLAGSLHRLLMHLWPTALFAYFMHVATPCEALRKPA